MKKRLFTIVLAGAVFTMVAMPVLSIAGNGRMAGQRIQTQSQSGDRIQTRQQLRDGSCLTGSGAAAGTAQKKGNTYGPGDGTGNQGVRPQDRTGYGAPTNR
jgi:hypothetical protein